VVNHENGEYSDEKTYKKNETVIKVNVSSHAKSGLRRIINC